MTANGYLVVMLNEIGPLNHVWEGMLEMAESGGFPHDILRLPENQSLNLENPNCIGLVTRVYTEKQAEDLARLSFPVINVGNAFGPAQKMGNLISDDTQVGEMAARHLLDRHYRILLSVAQPGTVHSQERQAGFRRIAKAGGARVVEMDLPQQIPGQDPEGWSPQDYLQALGRAMAPVLKEIPPDAGIFGTTDWITRQLQAVLVATFPERVDTVGLLGVDDSRKDRWIPGIARSISSVAPAFRKIGAAALQWMAEHGSDKKAAQTLLKRFEPEGVMERSSTAGTACAHPGVARAVRWSWERVKAGEPPRIKELSSFLNMSPRTIERLFQSHLGCTARERILAMRMDHAQQLLRGQTLNIGEIASHCGFAKQGIFSMAFRKHTGMSPREWRKAQA